MDLLTDNHTNRQEHAEKFTSGQAVKESLAAEYSTLQPCFSSRVQSHRSSPWLSRIHCNNELSSIQPGCTGCLPGRTGQSALAGWQQWCRCASHSRPSLPWLGTGRNIRGWWSESSVEKGEVAGILPAENTAKHVLCCLLKPVSNSILKLLVPDKCLLPGLHKYCCAQLHN